MLEMPSMKKSALRNLISSYTGPHVDLERSQMLKTKEDIDKKLEKILLLIDNEDEDGNSGDQSQLVSLIETFYHNYIYLYGRYDQLVGKLKRSIEHKEEINAPYADNISSSETSDLESNEMYTHNEDKENGTIFVDDKEEDLAAELAKREEACLSLENEMQRAREKIGVLEAENGSLSLHLEKVNQQHSVTSESFLRIREENEALVSGNSVLLQTLYDAENSVKALKDENQALKDKVADLEKECAAKGEIASTLDKIREELEEVVSENSRLWAENSSVRSAMAEMQCQKAELEGMLEDKAKEASETANELKEIDIQLMEANVSDLRVEPDVLPDQENVQESEKKRRSERLSTICKLLEAKDEAICHLEKDEEEKNVKIARLEEREEQILKSLELTETQKAQVDVEADRLNELTQTLEVHLRLTNQKFKITKSEFKEKEELHRRKMKEMREKCRDLEERKKDAEEEMKYMEYEVDQVREAMEVGMAKLTDAFQNMELAFEGNCGHFLTRLSKCSADLRALKNSLAVTSSRRELEQSAKLEAEAAGFRKTIHELEEIVRCKVEEGKLKDEEKREAIRQLCLAIDYHRENRKHLLRERSEGFGEPGRH